MEEWKEYRLGDISKMKYGKLPPKKNEGIYPIWSGYRNVGFATTYNCRKGTIVVIARGVGGTGDVKISNEDCYLTNLSISVELDTNICVSQYFYYKFKLSNLKYLNTGSAQSQITIDDLKRLTLKLPSLEKQIRITDILSSIDSKIDLNRRINENLEQQAQALFKSWFVDFEPFKDGKFVDSELGRIPEGWRVGVLADIANITMGQSPKGTSYNEIGDGISFYQGRAEFGNRFPSVRLFTTEPSRYAEPYSVLLSVRAPVGDINIAVERCCIGRGLASILSKNKHQSFVLYTMFFLKKELDKFNSEGTVFGSINRSSLENLKIIIPPVDIIDKFENLTSKIDVMLLNLFQETTSLAQLRDTLLPRLMSGELAITDVDDRSIFQ